MERREGLIRARMKGAVEAKSLVLTFLDSHIECTDGWLEPLIEIIAEDPKNVVCPTIDVIDRENFEFVFANDPKKFMIGGFRWGMSFSWFPVPERENKRRKNPYDPLISPTMAGGLFSIHKTFFQQLGMFDPEFDLWGGENLELSFKTWMCGGKLFILPCSHVGHIFRPTPAYKRNDMETSAVDMLNRNLKRLAVVWLDEYAKFFFMILGIENKNFGNVSNRLKIKSDLKCKSFKWYLKNVFSEQFDPLKSKFYGKVSGMFLNLEHKLTFLKFGFGTFFKFYLFFLF